VKSGRPGAGLDSVIMFNRYGLANKGHYFKKKQMDNKSKIIRTWKGWTTLGNAPIYEDMLVNEVFPAVKKKGVKGLEKVSISVKTNKEEVEFFLILQFDSLDAVKTFAGEKYEIAYIPENAKRVLSRYEETAQHYEFKRELKLKNEKQ